MTRPAARRARPLLLAYALFAASAAPNLGAQDLSGHWVYEENGQTAELDVRQPASTGRVSGTFSLFGQSAPIVGHVRAGTLVVESVGGIPASEENGTMTGQLQGGTLLFTVSQPGQAPVTLPMVRQGGPTTPAADDAPEGATAPRGNGAGAAARARAGGVRDFAGRWELTSDDGTSQEVVEITPSGDGVTGTVTSLEHGYFSGRTTVKRQVALRGTLRDGALQLRVWDAEGSPGDAVAGTAYLRGEYLVLRAGESESGYARPGVPLVRGAEGSSAAASLARDVRGHVYSAGQQAGGRGAYVGGRMRLALCADGSIEYDASDVATTPGPLGGGVDMGSSVSRRGTWDVVLLAGEPAVRAQWRGTGTSYSLTHYFRVRPGGGGRSAAVDGVELPATGRC
jgi:hypothetical protein